MQLGIFGQWPTKHAKIWFGMQGSTEDWPAPRHDGKSLSGSPICCRESSGVSDLGYRVFGLEPRLSGLRCLPEKLLPLVELLVVVGIILIIAAIAVPSCLPRARASYDQQRPVTVFDGSALLGVQREIGDFR